MGISFTTGTSNGTTDTFTSSQILYQFRPSPPPAPPKPVKPCPHRILGVACSIKPADLTRVYRRLAKANHPDIGPDAERATRTRRMAMINAAYEEAKG